jgi:hypothetical protein
MLFGLGIVDAFSSFVLGRRPSIRSPVLDAFFGVRPRVVWLTAGLLMGYNVWTKGFNEKGVVARFAAIAADMCR